MAGGSSYSKRCAKHRFRFYKGWRAVTVWLAPRGRNHKHDARFKTLLIIKFQAKFSGIKSMRYRKKIQCLGNALSDLTASRTRNLADCNCDYPISSNFNCHNRKFAALNIMQLISFRDLNLKGFSAGRVGTSSSKTHLYMLVWTCLRGRDFAFLGGVIRERGWEPRR